MTFTAFGRGSQSSGSITPINRLNGSNGDSPDNGNGNGLAANGHANGHAGNGNGHATNGNGNGHHAHLNGNGQVNGSTTNGNGQDSVNVNGNGNGRKTPSFRATLSSDVTITGTVKFRSELLIDGKVEGTIESHGRLTIGKNGHVQGDIQTRSVTVHGTVNVNLSVGEKCELRSGCTLRGDIETSRLVMEEDVNFIGNAAIATRDYLAELRMPNGHANGNGNGHTNGNGQHAGNSNGQNGSNGQH